MDSLQFWRPQVPNQGVGRVTYPLEMLGENPSSFWEGSAFLGFLTCGHIIAISPSTFPLPSACLHLPFCLYLPLHLGSPRWSSTIISQDPRLNHAYKDPFSSWDNIHRFQGFGHRHLFWEAIIHPTIGYMELLGWSSFQKITWGLNRFPLPVEALSCANFLYSYTASPSLHMGNTADI